jgi:hypothetical protein
MREGPCLLLEIPSDRPRRQYRKQNYDCYQPTDEIAKLPGHRPGLPGKVISFHIVPLDPAYKAGLAVHVPVKRHFFKKVREEF